VTETGKENHDQSEDDEVEKGAGHDVRAVVRSEVGDLHRVGNTREASSHEVKGELDKNTAIAPKPQAAVQR